MKKEAEGHKFTLGKMSGRIPVHFALDLNNGFTDKPYIEKH
jgi:hypothetical protein